MVQEYDKYTAEDFEVWKILFERQMSNLDGKACHEYLDCIHELEVIMEPNKVPDFRELDKALLAKNGWSIEVVPGLIPVKEFFELLANKRWCSSTWLRKKSQLDYLEEPDMFHDIFGHIPFFMNEDYANFAHKIGQLGVKHKNNDLTIERLKRVYWFTIEFGLIRKSNKSQIYGAGIISSSGETDHIYDDPVDIKDFNIREVMDTDFINSEIQTLYYQIDDLAELFNSLEEVESLL